MVRNLLLLVILTISMWLFSFRIESSHFPFSLEARSSDFSWVYSSHQPYHLCTLGAKLTKVRATLAQALSDSDSLKARVTIKQQMTAGGLYTKCNPKEWVIHTRTKCSLIANHTIQKKPHYLKHISCDLLNFLLKTTRIQWPPGSNSRKVRSFGQGASTGESLWLLRRDQTGARMADTPLGVG